MIPDGMDVAAEQAEEEFPAEGSVQDLARWWAKWYKTAGHKRLGRILVARSGRPVEEKPV